MTGIIGRFLRSAGGNMAIIGAIAMVPLVLAAGLGVDYARYTSAHKKLQEMADATALALVASDDRDDARLRAFAIEHLRANNNADRMQDVAIRSLNMTDEQVTLTLDGVIRASFLGLAGLDRLNVGVVSVAERARRGMVEIALILDNTYSMSAADAGGRTRISALKLAAADLVRQVLENSDGSVRIGVVPYAEYVNVGTQHRNAPWLSVPADYTQAPPGRTCEMRTTRTECRSRAPTYSCTNTVDGIEVPATCGGGCTEQVTVTVPPYEHCSGGGSAREFRWHGCVGSRTVSDTRLHVGRPDVRYPGYVEDRQNCLSPILPLTSNRGDVLTAIDGMVSHVGSYRPYTYIPSGLVWGYNLLSPTEPFAGADTFDSDNYRPRKVAVLMTDGENTLRLRNSDGRHIRFNGSGAAQANQRAATDADTLAICENMKAQRIEIFSVAFMVTNPVARDLLRRCASSDEHYFNASDSNELMASFRGISRSLTVVRLTR